MRSDDKSQGKDQGRDITWLHPAVDRLKQQVTRQGLGHVLRAPKAAQGRRDQAWGPALTVGCLPLRRERTARTSIDSLSH